MAKTTTQTEMLLRHFSIAPSISGVEAGAIYRIRSLHRRILDLEAQGYKFHRELRKDATGQRYMRYFFKGREAASTPQAAV
jgi:hypothetical protein